MIDKSDKKVEEIFEYRGFVRDRYHSAETQLLHFLAVTSAGGVFASLAFLGTTMGTGGVSSVISRVGNEFTVLEAMSRARRSLLEEMERDIDHQEELIARVRRRS